MTQKPPTKSQNCALHTTSAIWRVHCFSFICLHFVCRGRAASWAKVVSTSTRAPQKLATGAGTSADAAASDFSDPGSSEDSSNNVGPSDFSYDEADI